jgi:hypothetical protein
MKGYLLISVNWKIKLISIVTNDYWISYAFNPLVPYLFLWLRKFWIFTYGNNHCFRHIHNISFFLYFTGGSIYTLHWVLLVNVEYLFVYLQFCVSFKDLSLIWRHCRCRWRSAKFKSILGAQGLCARRDFYRATPIVTRGLGFPGFIRRTSLFIRLLRHTRWCEGSILTQILTESLFVYLFVCLVVCNFSAIRQLSTLPAKELQF